MENFRKVRTSEEESPLPFTDLPPDVVEMKVKEGSKIRNLMNFAMAQMELKGSRQIVFSGCGRAVTKTITCVEIMKRKLGGLHQVTKVRYKTLLEVWENQDPLPGGPAQNLTVHKNVPSICILLSRDPLDPNQTGYQPPEPWHGWVVGMAGCGARRRLWARLQSPCRGLAPWESPLEQNPCFFQGVKGNEQKIKAL
uniref:Ribonuclease P and MRP subunit p25 n=1 Tax=Falco tinnunculus TaxID=100819 RepID=A0A8C4V347_FALTI